MDSDVSISTLDHPWQGSPASPRVSAAPAAPSRQGGAYVTNATTAPDSSTSPAATTSLAPQHPAPRISRATSIFPKLAALLISTGLHTALALGAMQWTFTADTTRAQTRFRQGETQLMNVRLTLAPPSPTFTESTVKTTPETEPQPPAPQPPAAPHAPAPPQPAPPTPSDFAGKPDPALPDKEQPGDAPGLSANPKNTLATTEPVEQPERPDDVTPQRPDERKEEPVRHTVADPAAPPPPVPADTPKTKPTETSPIKPSQPAVAASIAPTAKSDAPAQPTNMKTTAIARATPRPREALIPESVPVPPTPPATSTTPTPPPSAPKPQPAEATSPAPASTPGVTRDIELIDLIEPRYPFLSIRAREEGSVVLEIEVLSDGSVGEVRVIASPGFKRLEDAAIDAVKRSRFEPATRNGNPVPARITKEFRFVLKDARGR